MIPKIIHCVWLSGSPKEKLHVDCINSWKAHMPDYEIIEWNTQNLPKEILENTFVQGALFYKKYAFATDVIRSWALYSYGGIYMDLDVMAFRSLDCFLKHEAFSSSEFWPVTFYESLRKKKYDGLGIEAAVMGCIAKHPWMKDIYESYKNKIFINSNEFMINNAMPKLILDISSSKYGYRPVPMFQMLKKHVAIYPPDTFSSCYDTSLYIKEETTDNQLDLYHLGEINLLKYTCHICSGSWTEKSMWNKKSRFSFLLKKIILRVFGKKNVHNIRKIFTGYKNRIDKF